MSAVLSLLESVVDYAGLFPPAKLAMPDAVRAHADHLAGPHRAMLGRFVVPLARLVEFDAAFASLPAPARSGWRLSVLAGDNPAEDAAAVAAFNARAGDARIVAVETKATNTDEVVWFTASFPQEIEVWVEVPPATQNLSALLERVRSAGRGAKLRTGGVTPDAFPPPTAVARFLRECHRAGVVMKATAGLHHPLRGDYPLTYEPGSPRAKMFGFLNLLFAAALVRTGGSDAEVLTVLEEGDARHFTASQAGLAWHDHFFSGAQLAEMRRALCRSFGSCSFTEPLDGLRELSWL